MGLFEQFPYTNYDRLNLDALIVNIRTIKKQIEELDDLPEQMTALNLKVNEIETLYNTFASDITAQFEDLKADNIETFNILKESIEAQFELLKTDIQDQVDALSASVSALDTRLSHILNNLPSEVYMLSPFTGEQTSLENIIFELANTQRTESLTAGEYDALNLTASAYDAKNISAYNYDWNAKQLLP